MTTLLIFPMVFYVFYIGALALFTLNSRVNAVRRGDVHVKHYKTMNAEQFSERLIIIGRHYDNQFQLPILFLVTCLAHIALGRSNLATVGMAWLFIGTRLLHSYIHLGKNHVGKRAAAFAAGWAVIAIMWAQLGILALN